MNENINWENAINIRRSTRSFEQLPIEEQTMARLKSFVSEMDVPFLHDVKIRFFKVETGSKIYLTQASPPDNMAFIADTDTISISKAGFVGEMAILYATGLGLATCWYGHYSLKELEAVMPHLGDHKDEALSDPPKGGYGKGEVKGKRAICITPLGYWKEKGIRLIDRFQTSFFSHKRKPLGELLEHGIKVEILPPEIHYALDLARKAPSGLNSQFWRFGVSSDYKTVSIAMPVDYKHIKWEHPNVDIGICACHFWLGLMMKNVDCRVSLSKEQDRAVWRFEILG